MTDIQNPKLIYLKGILFLLVGITASTLLILQAPSVRIAALLLISIWSFCRFYYFAFYVIQHYVDPQFRFAGLIDFLRYAMGNKRGSADAQEGKLKE